MIKAKDGAEQREKERKHRQGKVGSNSIYTRISQREAEVPRERWMDGWRDRHESD